MKKMILLNLLILSIPVILYGQDKVEAPVWSIGDKWTYKGASGDQWTNEVVNRKDDLYILKTGASKDLNAFDKNSMNLKMVIDESGKEMEADSALRKLFDFPISVGKTWSDTTTSYPTSGVTRMGKIIYDHDFKVEGMEEIAITAGKFKAYKIHYNQTNRNTKRSGWVRFWYSPDVKNWIRREGEKISYWEKIRWARDAELISYSLK